MKLLPQLETEIIERSDHALCGAAGLFPRALLPAAETKLDVIRSAPAPETTKCDFHHIWRECNGLRLRVREEGRVRGIHPMREQLEHFPSALNRRDSQPLSPRRMWGN